MVQKLNKCLRDIDHPSGGGDAIVLGSSAHVESGKSGPNLFASILRSTATSLPLSMPWGVYDGQCIPWGTMVKAMYTLMYHVTPCLQWHTMMYHIIPVCTMVY